MSLLRSDGSHSSHAEEVGLHEQWPRKAKKVKKAKSDTKAQDHLVQTVLMVVSQEGCTA